MKDEEVRKMLLRSNTLTEREQTVWAAVFARSGMFQMEDGFRADNAVKALRRIDPDELGPMSPEYAALSAGVHISEEEFGPWYRVAWRLAMRHSLLGLDEAGPRHIELAYETYLRSQGDFY